MILPAVKDPAWKKDGWRDTLARAGEVEAAEATQGEKRAMKKTTLLKQLINRPAILVIPGAYDCLSAKMIEKAGFQAVQVSGYGVSACLLGQPDVGLLSFDEVLRHTRNICQAVNIPVMADGDTGYGNAINVIRAVREFEQAGAAGLNLEDQAWPKRCGAMAGKEVIPAEEMAKKIEAAVWARRDPDFVINARTDAGALFGREEVVRRSELYWKAGADLLFLDSTRSRDDLRFYSERLARKGIRCSVYMMDESGNPPVTFEELEQLGFARVSVPVLSATAAAKGIYDAVTRLRKDGTDKFLRDQAVSSAEFNEIIGLAEIQRLEKKFLPAGVLTEKYGPDAVRNRQS